MGDSKVVVISGATSMIGKILAKILAQKKFRMILLGHTLEKLEILAQSLDTSVEIYPVDMAHTSESFLGEILHKEAQIDAVIYNTALYPWKTIDALSLEEWRTALDVNLTGAFLMVRACAPLMKAQKKGSMVFISSLAGETLGVPYMSAYATSKAALNGFMRTAALEFAPYHITVNSISPGKVYDAEILSQEEVLQKTQSIPLGRFIDPEDIAHLAEFLISKKAKNMTGQNFIVDGGQSIS